MKPKFVEFRCAHTDLPISGCDHCRPAPQPVKAKPKPTAKKRVTARRTPKEPTMPTPLIPAPATKGWEASAACRRPGADPSWWSASPNTSESARARAWCAGCPVAAQCLELAMDAEGSTAAGHRYGVFGGLTGPQRRDLYDKRRKATA